MTYQICPENQKYEFNDILSRIDGKYHDHLRLMNGLGYTMNQQ